MAGHIDGSIRTLIGPITIDGDLAWSLGTEQGSSEVFVTGSQVRTVPEDFPIVFERRPVGFLWNILD
jgi:hypothetical protein